MNFISILYGLFLFSAVAIYWSVEEKRLRLWTLFIASVAFYASLQVMYLPLLLIIVLMNYQLGLAIGQNTSPGKHNQDWRISDEEWQFANSDWNRRRLWILSFGIVTNLLLLFTFKYTNFLLKPFPILASIIPNTSDSGTLKIIVPLGISYITFECIAYLIDIYRGAPASQKFLDFAAYKLFFTKITSGPITRFQSLASQFAEPKLPTPNLFAEALWLIAKGAVKKGLVADNIGIYVDLCFGNIQRAGSTDLWLATLAYGLQLYLDFSGYVDIARGSALLFGLVLPENFDFPYFSTSIADFWRRWHMTLGDWLRNYLYFPLGGSRRGLVRTCINLIIVMLIAGIWHGAALGFLVWGLLHGFALAIHRLTDVVSDRTPVLKLFWQSPPGTLVAWLLTQLMVFFSWIWFKLPNLQDSLLVVKNLWGHPADSQFAQLVYVESLKLSQTQLGMAFLLLMVWMSVFYIFQRRFQVQFKWHLKLVLVPLCFYFVWLLAPEGSLPFIYFDY
jgi:alginate O-acetyltransferase complex protein AlgI